jgi:hypothetical protein
MTAPPVDHPIIAELDQTRAALADLVDRHLAARAVTA